MPDQAEAQAGIAKHIKNFWDPRMRKALFALVDADASEAIKPIVRAALEQHRAMFG
jgi:formate dehydrogenase subunit delta